MSSGVHSTAITIGAMPASAITPRCVGKCVTKCVNALHTSTAARPRQHWVFATSPSQTTRPPRRSSVGWVRVVWLGVFSVRVLAGAGSHGLVMQAQAVMSWWVVGGRDLEWQG
jgi:hypothetical protein